MLIRVITESAVADPFPFRSLLPHLHVPVSRPIPPPPRSGGIRVEPTRSDPDEGRGVYRSQLCFHEDVNKGMLTKAQPPLSLRTNRSGTKN